jgi:protein CpxP
MRARPLVLAMSAGAAVMLTAAFASAQQGPPPPDGPRGDMRQHVMEMRAERLDHLKTILQLRPDQDAAFQAFKAALTPPERPREAQRPQGELTTPQMLDRLDQHISEMKAHFDRIKSATLTFYAALSPEQQKAFDLIVRQRHMSMGGGMGPGMPFGRMDGHWDGHKDGRMGGRRNGPGGPPEDGPPPPPPPAG